MADVVMHDAVINDEIDGRHLRRSKSSLLPKAANSMIDSTYWYGVLEG
jgi:hypothetical protein